MVIVLSQWHPGRCLQFNRVDRRGPSMLFNHVAQRVHARHFETVANMMQTQLGFVELRRTDRSIWLRQPGTKASVPAGAIAQAPWCRCSAAGGPAARLPQGSHGRPDAVHRRSPMPARDSQALCPRTSHQPPAPRVGRQQRPNPPRRSPRTI